MQAKKLLQWCLFIAHVFYVVSVMAETGVFWQATKPDSKTVYLFGTMHSDDNRITTFTDQTLAAIKSVEVFMLETEQPKSPEPLLTRQTLSGDLTEAEMDQVNTLADQYVIRREFALHMKPWLLAVILAAPKPQTPFGQDHLLKAEAENLGKRIEALETVEDHFGVMDAMPRAEQLSLLKAVLARELAEKEADFEQVMQAYLSGDLDQILTVNENITGGLVSDKIWQKMKARLIIQRNKAMASRLMAVAKEQHVFVAVGASHLAGDTGLINQLKKAGFKLKALKGLKTD